MAIRLSPCDFMEKLVSFPTVSRDSNLPLVDRVEGYQNSHGVTAHRHYDESLQKAALFAHVGPGRQRCGSVGSYRCGASRWSAPASDPFTVVDRDG